MRNSLRAAYGARRGIIWGGCIGGFGFVGGYLIADEEWALGGALGYGFFGIVLGLVVGAVVGPIAWALRGRT